MDQLIQFFVFLGLGKEINWMKLEDAYVEAKKRYALIHAQSVQSLQLNMLDASLLRLVRTRKITAHQCFKITLFLVPMM